MTKRFCNGDGFEKLQAKYDRLREHVCRALAVYNKADEKETIPISGLIDWQDIAFQMADHLGHAEAKEKPVVTIKSDFEYKGPPDPKLYDGATQPIPGKLD